MSKFKTKIYFTLFLIVFIVFCYFRLKPIFLQTFPYTFDQGRDFLKVEEIVRYKNLSFIGPTTGIQGLYHGAWWYYMLAIPYILFNGSPIGFAFFIFFINLTATYFFYRFLKKEFNFLTAIFFLLLATTSPYLIMTSFFVISSAPELPLILILLISTYYFFKKKSFLYQFLIFLNLGLILEQEIPTGLFLVPSYFIALIFTKQFKKLNFKINYLFYSFIAFIIPIIPRILFELKNNFLQTRSFLIYISNPKIYSPKPFMSILNDRLIMFSNFYKSLFNDESQTLALILLAFFIFGLVLFYRKIKGVQKIYFNFIFLVSLSIFLLSFLYKDNFWGNYLEGFPYFYLILFSIVFHQFTKNRSYWLRLISIVIIFVLVFLNIKEFYLSIAKKENIPFSGLRSQIQKLDYLYNENGNKNYCLRIYTPPVIPHTYNYLLSYYERTKNYKKPVSDYVNNKCWYLIEKEQKGYLFELRIVKWRDEQIPKKTKLIKTKSFEDGTEIELWEKL